MLFFRATRKYFRELYVFLRNIRYLNYLRLEFRGDREKIEPTKETLLAPFKFAKEGYEKSHIIYKPEGQSEILGNKVEVIYVNGIMTDKDEAERQTFVLNNFLKRPVTLFFNESNGFIEDIYDCVRMKIGNKSDDNSKELKRYIQFNYSHRNIKNFIIVGYSQGSIIASHALNQLPKSIKRRINIVFLTFGSAQESLKPLPKGKALHIVHADDFVSRIGPIHYASQNMIFGDLHIHNDNKHSFDSYINTFNNDSTIREKIKKLLK